MTPHRICIAARLAALALAGLLPACVHRTPELDAHLGDAVRIALARQVLHPNAAGNADPVLGLDGRSARGALERYQKSFSEPERQGASPAMIGGGGGK